MSTSTSSLALSLLVVLVVLLLSERRVDDALVTERDTESGTDSGAETEAATPSNNCMVRRHQRSPRTQQSRSNLNTRPTWPTGIIVHPQSRRRRLRHRGRNWLKPIHSRTHPLLLLLRSVAATLNTAPPYRSMPQYMRQRRWEMHIPKLTPAALNHHLWIQFPSLREGRRSFPINKRMAAALSNWTCRCFERTKLDASRHCRVCSHLCLFKQFGRW